MSTIVALATPWGYAALALVRLSGPATAQVVSAICKPMGFGGLSPGAPPRRVWLVDDQGVYDDGLVWIARAPRTYTGEDTAEITLHGNPLLVERLLAAAVGAGARQAMPGAFTRRAVIHGKLDMIAAEGVLQAAQARTMRGVSVARSAMDGRLATHLAGLRSQLVRTTAELEARLDYPGDELALEDDASLVRGLNRTHAELTTLASTFRSGRIVVQGARVALVGAVNAGKSSLFNALLGKKRALVHETPGTTRDVLEASRMIRGVAVTLLDTAGERTTDDPIEAAGLALAQELVADADLVILVLRARPEGLTETERMLLARTAHKPRVVVCNGVDVADPPPLEAILTVATTGQGLEDLERAITKALVGDLPGTAQHVIAAAWQRDALLAAARGVQEAKQALPTAGVAVAADALTQAIEALDALTGADTREDVLDALFSRFCVGK